LRKVKRQGHIRPEQRLPAARLKTAVARKLILPFPKSVTGKNIRIGFERKRSFLPVSINGDEGNAIISDFASEKCNRGGRYQKVFTAVSAPRFIARDQLCDMIQAFISSPLCD